ncbi:putative aromatic compound monooxygenase YhjG [Cytospora mali]|uniref:Aromatic compound monooxygenase YhjG n=1 Tax=Cytospora mali TaxID=578113 RepID=A0A194V2C1_CYTMA|nr:putative aromatic compound monooxygenase YhjG [Valsa mali var. pyri (nom. inval.)]
MASPSVLIVGAGPVGLTAALALQQGGVPAGDILVADQRPTRDLSHTWSKALSCSASSLEVFRILGIADRFMNFGIAMHKTHFGAGSRLLDLSYDVLGTRYPFNMYIPQVRTESVLLERCEEVGIAFAWGRRFVGLTQTGEEVSATFKVGDGEEIETIRTSWLIGCDGTGSAVRQAAGIAFEGPRATRYNWFADGHADEDAPTIKSVTTEGGRAMMFATGDGKTGRRIAGCTPPSEIVAGQRPVAPDLEFIRDWAAHHFGSHYNFRDVNWRTVIGNGMRFAESFRSGRVFIAGDAAHQLYPAGGQGMNTGLLDATNLAWKLTMVITGKTGTNTEVVERVLDSYTKERLAAVQAVRHNVEMQQVSIFETTDRDKAVADFIAEALDEPALNQRWARRVCGFADPVEPYQLAGLGLGEEMVGTRVTHVSDSNSDDMLDAAKHNIFIVGFVAGSVFADENHPSLEQVVRSSNRPDQVRILDKVLQPTSPKWKGITAVLIRPDLRIAWVAREGSNVTTTQESFTRVLEWWVGGSS